jgi:acyl carrier protein
MNTQERIRAVIARTVKKEVVVSAEESLFDSGILDSFSLVDVVAGVEQEFRIKVPDSDLNPRKFSSISKIEAYLGDLK